MNKYQNGKIYIITGSECDKVYLGSTITTLKQRLTKHKNRPSSNKEILKNKEFNICLLETYPCNSKKELLWRERYWYDELKSILVNVLRPIVTKEERLKDRKEYRKEWKKNHKEFLSDYIKEYNKNNKERKKKQGEKYTLYKNSWGGDYRYNNNLLKINKDVFE